MSDEIMLVFGEDGVAREYDDTWDITIHCESEEEQKAVLEKLNNSNQEPQELSKNSPKLDKENGDLQPTCNQLATDVISRQAAIDDIKECAEAAHDNHEWDMEQGYLNAIECIEELPSPQPKIEERTAESAQNVPKEDLISRKEAIDAVENIDCSDGVGISALKCEAVGDVVTAIKALPSAQPEIIYCKDCKHHWTHRCMDSMPTEICELGQTFYDANVDFCSLAERRTDD